MIRKKLANKSKFVFNEDENMPPSKASSKVAAQFPGRIRKSCPMHKSPVFLLDVDACKVCNNKSLREYDLPEGMELEVKNVKIKI